MAIEIKYSVYPSAIDGGSQLPVICDNITEVNAESINRHRSAIIAIEGELGIDPSGVYTTVRARLDALEQLIANIGGGGSGITTILDEGVLIDNAASSINFIGDIITATSDGAGNITVQVDGYAGAAVQKQETIPVSSPSQVSFTLTEIPADATAVEMFVNGIKQQYGADYIASGTTVTYLDTATYPLNPPDVVEFWYLVSGFISGSGGTNLTVQENGTTIEAATSTINFTGGVSVVSTGPGFVNVGVSGSASGTWGDSLALGNFSDGYDVIISPSSEIKTPDVNNQNVYDLTLTAGNVLSGNGDGGNILINSTSGLGSGSDGYVIINGISWPFQDGSAGQSIITDGAGNLSFATQGGSASVGPVNNVQTSDGSGEFLATDWTLNGGQFFYNGVSSANIGVLGSQDLSLTTNTGNLTMSSTGGQTSVNGQTGVVISALAGALNMTGSAGLTLNAGGGVDNWPVAQGTGALVNDGSGNLTWESSDEVEISAEVTTVNSTPVTIISNTPNDGAVTNIVVKFAAYDGTSQEGAVFISQGAFITNSGSTAQIGSTAITHIERQDATWAVDFSTSGADILVTVQGDAVNSTKWKAVAKIVQVI